MKRKRILYGLTILIVVLTIGIALALVPPPPANQDLGIYDTLCKEFAEEDCRACHSSGVPDTHHLLVQNDGYGCLDCHVLGPDGGIGTVIRDCVVCHDASPHHGAAEAVARHCSHCHGSFVDDYDDGHSIPTYEQSLITPDTSYTVEDNETGKKWGGCEACHEPDNTAEPPIYSNPMTHHNLGDLSLECDMCHTVSPNGYTEGLSIRKCEDCHGIQSLHNIQYDYTNTKGQLGWGHIGDNWDCAGCHAWYVAYSGAPQTGPIIPGISEVSPGELVAGEETVVTITGTNFVNTVNNIAYTSNVVIDTGAGTITVEPESITATEMVLTVPALDSGRYGLHVVKSDMKSKLVSIVVVPQVTIDSITVRRDVLTIRGSGFGDNYLGSGAELLGVAVDCEGNILETHVISWHPNRIVVQGPATAGDKVTVKTLYGSDSATIAGSGR